MGATFYPNEAFGSCIQRHQRSAKQLYLLLPAFQKIPLKIQTVTEFKVVFVVVDVVVFIVGDFTWRPPYTTWIAQARSKVKSDQGQEVSPLRQSPDKPTPVPHGPRLSL